MNRNVYFLKLKLFSILASVDIISKSVNNLLTKTTMSIDAMMPNGRLMLKKKNNWLINY